MSVTAVETNPRKKKRLLSSETSELSKSNVNLQEKCPLCKKSPSEVVVLGPRDKESVEEFVALTNPKLSFYENFKSSIDEKQEFPIYKISLFAVYDKEGHLCSFDEEQLIEDDVELYFTGFIKPVFSEGNKLEDAVAAHDLGPINEWWIQGLEEGKQACIFLSTQFAEYHLMEPASKYKTFYNKIKEKVALTKLVLEFLVKNSSLCPAFEDLLDFIHDTNKFKLREEELLLQNAEFICNQILNFEQSHKGLDLSSLPCTKNLLELTGVSLKERSQFSKKNDNLIRDDVITLVKATTTNLVKQIFESFSAEDTKSVKKIIKTCPGCKICQDCMSCANCKDKKKFGGPGKKRQKCSNKRDCRINNKNAIIELGDEIEGTKSFGFALVNNLKVNPGDFVLITTETQETKLIRISEIFKEAFHGQNFVFEDETILREVAGKEVYMTFSCQNFKLDLITSKVQVLYKNCFNYNLSEFKQKNNPKNKLYFYTKAYDQKSCRFEDLNFENEPLTCYNCIRNQKDKAFNTKNLIVKQDKVVQWKGEEFKAGSHVFLKPEVFKFYSSSDFSNENKNLPKVDQTIYPEYYRKLCDNLRIRNLTTPEPWVIGQIEEVIKGIAHIFAKVRLYCRPENTQQIFGEQKEDFNYLYWTSKTIKTKFDNITGKCFVKFSRNFSGKIREWSLAGPNRFYFDKKFDFKTKAIGRVDFEFSELEEGPVWKEVLNPLSCMDVFAGCGGLSKGLHDSKVAITKWAIEMNSDAAEAYHLNNPSCNVFVKDCNELLQQVFEGEALKMGLPERGQVDLLIGGPPCQGFSKMNRFSDGKDSNFKNSLVVSYLSFCDYYRPKFFLLENVKNFATFNNGLILKMTIKCLLAMGYQVTFGVLQAGQFGLPQSRKRFFLIGAQKGCKLPSFPEPLHVFRNRECLTSFVLDGVRYNIFEGGPAPFRMVCTRDAISDLPEIFIGKKQQEKMVYNSKARSCYQRVLRGDCVVVRDHLIREVTPINQARLNHIPVCSGADWRDLPNIRVELSDGTFTDLLQYPYRLKRQNKDEHPQGVCKCATGQKCNPDDRQTNTLIPFCLPHTAERSNNWTGLFGRLDWDGFFFTTTTSPDPMGKQGRVVHPEQNRVISVRECARSQGFEDSFQFYGSIAERYRQIGNAVPPPVGFWLGKAILKSL